MRIFKLTVSASLGLGLLLFAYGCNDQVDAEPSDRLIVTTIYPLTYLAEEIAGDTFEVVQLVEGNADPHVFDPTPSVAAQINSSDLLIYTSDLFETWVPDVVATQGNVQVLAIAEGDIDTHLEGDDEHAHDHDEEMVSVVVTFSDNRPGDEHAHEDKEGDEHAHDEEGDEHAHDEEGDEHAHDEEGDEHAHDEEGDEHAHDEEGDEHAHDEEGDEHAHEDKEGEDEHGHEDEEGHSDTHSDEGDGHAHEHDDSLVPHPWVVPSGAVDMATQISEKLLTIASADEADQIRSNTEALMQRLMDLDQQFDARFAGCDLNAFAIQHAAFTLFAEEYGFEQLAVRGGGNAVETSGAAAAAIVEEIRAHGINHILDTSGGQDQLLQVIADEAGVDIIQIPNLEAPSVSTDYFTLMEEVLDGFSTALGCEA